MHSPHIPLCPTTSTFLHHPTVTTGTRCIMRVKDVAMFMAAYPTTTNPIALPSYQLVMLELLHQLTHTGSYCRRALYLAMRSAFLHSLSTRATASSSSAHRWVKTTWYCPPSWSLPVSYWHTQLDRLLTSDQWSISTFTPQMQPHKCKCLLALLVCHPCTRHNHRTCLQLGSLTKMLSSLLFSKHRDKRSHTYLHWKPHYAIHPW